MNNSNLGSVIFFIGTNLLLLQTRPMSDQKLTSSRPSHLCHRICILQIHLAFQIHLSIWECVMSLSTVVLMFNVGISVVDDIVIPRDHRIRLFLSEQFSLVFQLTPRTLVSCLVSMPSDSIFPLGCRLVRKWVFHEFRLVNL